MELRMGIRELRDGLTAAIRRVLHGDTIEVTHDGVPVARIVPVRRGGVGDLLARGEATLPTNRLDPALAAPGAGDGAHERERGTRA